MPIPSVSRPGPTPELPEIGPATLYRAAVLLEKAGAFADRQWHQGAKARDAEDRPVWIARDPGQYPQPLRYCAIGHIERVCQAEDAASFYQPLLVTWLAQEIHAALPPWNDEPGRAGPPPRSGNCSAGYPPGSTGKPPPKSPTAPPRPDRPLRQSRPTESRRPNQIRNSPSHCNQRRKNLL